MSAAPLLDLKALAPELPARPLSDWDDVVAEEGKDHPTLRAPVFYGLLLLIFGFGGFFLWAYKTPLAQASMAPGRIIVESNTKTVTHLEGGTLASIAVVEGDRVAEGSVLARLDVTRSQANLTRLSQQLFSLQVRQARLEAEKSGAERFDFTAAAIADMDQADVDQAIANERNVFAERTKLYNDLISVDRSVIAQLKSQRDGLVGRVASMKEQLALVKSDLDVISKLAEKRLATTFNLSDKKLQLVDLQARIDDANTQIAENGQRKSQLELTMVNRTTDRQRDIAEQLQAIQTDINRIIQERIYAQDVVDKAEIVAPISGVVANIKIRTPGSAVISGQPLMDIVPANQPMLIQGVVHAADIDSMRLGARAEIKLSAFGSAEAQPLIGEIVYIAPDSIVDERTGEPTYAFKARIVEAELSKQPNLFLYPGMSAEVFIINGNRSALAYLLEPVRKSFSKAFREQ